MKAAHKPHTGFDSALEHHRAGRLAQAEAAYRKVIEKDAASIQRSSLRQKPRDRAARRMASVV
jgi:hypothetical protein